MTQRKVFSVASNAAAAQRFVIGLSRQRHTRPARRRTPEYGFSIKQSVSNTNFEVSKLFQFTDPSLHRIAEFFNLLWGVASRAECVANLLRRESGE
jgi:hypothetical protein